MSAFEKVIFPIVSVYLLENSNNFLVTWTIYDIYQTYFGFSKIGYVFESESTVFASFGCYA